VKVQLENLVLHMYKDGIPKRLCPYSLTTAKGESTQSCSRPRYAPQYVAPYHPRLADRHSADTFGGTSSATQRHPPVSEKNERTCDVDTLERDWDRGRVDGFAGATAHLC